MLDMTEKLKNAGIFPTKTTFSDGRMATKEAWNFCQELCKVRGIRAPTLRTFKHHLINGELIPAIRVPNPFGGNGPDRVYAIEGSAVESFVDELERQGDKLHVIVETPPKRVAQPPMQTRVAPPKPVPPKETNKEFNTREAFHYIQTTVGRKCELNSTTFDFYLTYDLISSRWSGNQRLVRQDDLDAYLELAPDGVYANHIEYEISTKRGPGEMSMKDAYAYYRDIDPNPVTLNSFRSLVAAGILQAIRTTNDPTAPVVGFKKRDIDGFLATRQRILEKNKQTTKREPPQKTQGEDPPTVSISPEVTKLLDAALAQAHAKTHVQLLEGSASMTVPVAAKPKKIEAEVEAPKKVKETEGKKTPTSEKAVAPKKTRWVTTKKAYVYYAERAKRSYTDSWFRDKVYRGSLFRTKTEPDVRPNNPSGKKYMVDLDSVDEYLAKDPKTQPKPQKSWPTEKAYHKFNHLIPAGLSMLQFKRLVNTGLIKSFTRSSVVHVRLDAVEAYFEGLMEVDTDKALQMGPAYDYYCSRCSDPVAKAHFSRWVTDGEIEGGEKSDEGRWTITVGSIDEFIEQYPNGRMRTNRNSRVVSESRDSKKSSKNKAPLKTDTVLPAPAPTPTSSSAGIISISMSDYKTPKEMKKALELLMSQGFEVSVKP